MSWSGSGDTSPVVAVVAHVLIAATALSAGLPLYTRNIDNFSGLEGVVDIVEVRA